MEWNGCYVQGVVVMVGDVMVMVSCEGCGGDGGGCDSDGVM